MKSVVYLLYFCLLTTVWQTTIASTESTGTAFQQQVHSAAIHSLEEKAVKLLRQHQASRYQVSVLNIPARTSLPLCSEALKAEFQSTMRAGHQRLRISCQKPARWSLFVKGNIHVFRPVLTSLRLLSAGDKINSSNLALEERDIGELRRGFFTSQNQLNNRQIARRVKAGSVLTPAMVEPEQLINRGDQVIVTVSQSNIEISMPGRALESGFLGKQIRVRNLSSGKIISGRITDKGIVSIH